MRLGIFFALLIILPVMGLFEDFEKSQVFFPTRLLEGNPRDVGLSYEDVYLKTEDGLIIHGWYVPHGSSQSALLLLHGNAGNISHRLPDLERFHRMGLHVLIIDYRGYGKSEGSPSEEGTYLDAQAAYRFLRDEKDFRPEKIVVFGSSLGAAVAIDLCARYDAAGLVSESAFVSVQRVAQETYPMLPVHWFLTMKYDSLSKVRSLKLPKLFLHSVDDEMIPFQHALDLFEAAAEPKELFRMQGSHNDTFLVTPRYEETLKGFVEKVLPRER